MMRHSWAFHLHQNFKKGALVIGVTAIFFLLIVTVTRIRAAALKQGRGVAPVTIRGAVSSEPKTASPSGEVAGASTGKPSSKSLPFAQSLLNRPIVQTQLAQPAPQVQYIYVPVNTNSSTQQSVQATPTAGSSSTQTSAAATSTPTSQPPGQPTVAASTNTPTPPVIQGLPTSTPTRIPMPTFLFIPTVAIQPTSTPQPATPTQSQPSFSASIGTTVEGDTVNATISANKELFLCVFTFYKGGNPDIKQSSPGGTSCASSSGGAAEVTKIDVRVESKTHESSNLSKSAPFN